MNTAFTQPILFLYGGWIFFFVIYSLTDNLNLLVNSMTCSQIAHISMEGFTLYYEPLISSVDESVVGYEALLRKIDSNGKVSYPIDFLKEFEKHDLMTSLDEWVVDRAVKDVKRAMYEGWVEPVNINVSPRTMENYEAIARICQQVEVVRGYINVEITEAFKIGDYLRVNHSIERLRDVGVKVFLDDIGVEAFVTTVTFLDVDGIKIDKKLTQSIGNKTEYFRRSTIEFAKEFDLKIVWEGVETLKHATQISFYCSNNVHLQGWLFSKALPFKSLPYKTSSIHMNRLAKNVDAEDVIECKEYSPTNISSNYEFLFRALMKIQSSNLPIYIYFKDKNLQIIDGNDAYVSLFGMDREALVGKTGYDLFPVDIAKKYERNEMQVLSGVVDTLQVEEAYQHNGEDRCMLTTIYPMFGDGVEGIVSIAIDITERKVMENELEQLSIVDVLTGLSNRRGLRNYVDHLHLFMTRRTYMCALLDLDDFKKINDIHGHDAGDEVLKDFSSKIKSIFVNDFVCRYGGEEFLLISSSGRSEFTSKLKLLYDYSQVGVVSHYSFSGGVIESSIDVSFSRVIKLVDLLLYRAKREGKGRFFVNSQGEEVVYLSKQSPLK
ncbi:EAL domain-containing protein [Vibrio sp. 10N.222.55.E8]|uniref:EAL domain-containing protein n=1 Tax=Vibrio artabrorum TaxID=446374 RepID=UPI00354E77FB